MRIYSGGIGIGTYQGEGEVGGKNTLPPCSWGVVGEERTSKAPAVIVEGAERHSAD